MGFDGWQRDFVSICDQHDVTLPASWDEVQHFFDGGLSPVEAVVAFINADPKFTAEDYVAAWPDHPELANLN